MSMMQFTCVKCGEIFCEPEGEVIIAPSNRSQEAVYLDEETGDPVTHGEREDGTECGGFGRFDGCWGEDYEALARMLGWQGCKLANAMCPEDLCVLPLNKHRGGHLLGTMHREMRVKAQRGRKAKLFMVPSAENARDLIRAGSDRAKEIWPGET